MELLFLALPLFVLPMGYLIWIAVLYRRPPVTGTSILPPYEPPEGLGPVEAAFLLDGALKPRAFAAMLLDLHLRGVLAIDQAGGKTSLSIRSGDAAAIAPYERRAIDVIFAASSSVTAADMPKGKSRSLDDLIAEAERSRKITAVQAAVIDSLRAKGILAERDLMAPILFAASAASSLIFFLGFLPILGFVGAAGTAASMILLAQFAYIAATWRPPLTTKGRKALLRLLGFRMFLGAALADRIVWEERELHEFDRYLPYAVVFEFTMATATKLQAFTNDLAMDII